ncbi:MAG: cytochrome b5 domain-containing protein [Rubrivivax sp.]|nr:cytochrome b5 domain-containing protein [Rubrivivax sp.]
MKALFLLATALFWLAVAAFGWFDRPPAAAPAVQPPSAAPSAASARPERRYTLAEVARHATPADCWMAIDGGVYDFSAYLPQHPSDPALIEPWCGREASEAYRTKTRGRPHSQRATAMMAGYRMGTLD